MHISNKKIRGEIHPRGALKKPNTSNLLKTRLTGPETRNIPYCRVPKGGVFKGGGNWGTLRIPREDWGTLGKIREPPPLGTPLNNPITVA